MTARTYFGRRLGRSGRLIPPQSVPLLREPGLLDRTSYRRRKRPALITADAPDGTPLVAKIDGADLRAGVLHETKKGRSEEAAHKLQLRFYLWVLTLGGVTRADGSRSRRQARRPRVAPHRARHAARRARGRARPRRREPGRLAEEPTPPERHPRRTFCRRCAFEDLCYG